VPHPLCFFKGAGFDSADSASVPVFACDGEGHYGPGSKLGASGAWGDEEVAYGMKAQWAGSQVGAPVALLREGNDSPDRHFFKNAVGSARIVSGDVFPNFV
jgi:hypothetical protein